MVFRFKVMFDVKRFSLVIFLSIVLLLAACQDQPEQAAAPQRQLPSVSVAEVVVQTVTEWDEFTGRLQAPERVDLRPRTSGYIEQVLFEEGSLVKVGDVLIQIDDRSIRADISGLQAQLDSAKTQLSLDQSEFKRAEELFKRQAISTEILDLRRAEKQRAESSVKTFKSSLSRLKLELDFSQIKSPINGRISRAFVTKGNYVTLGQTLLTSIVSTKEMHAYFTADERTYLSYAKRARTSQGGMKPSVYMALTDEKGYPHKGQLDFIDNQINADTGTILARASFSNPNEVFLPGMFARLRIVGSVPHEVVLIDDKAVGTDFNKKFVLALDKENKVQYRSVTLGEKIAGLRIVHTGLNKGDKIVVDGLQRVRPGTPVNAEQVPMASESVLKELSYNKQELQVTEKANDAVKIAHAEDNIKDQKEE